MPSGWKAILADEPNIDKMMKMFEDEMERYLDIVGRRFESSVATWDSKPTFKKEVTREGPFGAMTKIVGEVSTEDQVYFWLNEGTSVRYATMTPNFRAKTKPGRIRSGAGSGGVAYVNKNVPRPGIKPRKWDELIAIGTKRNFELAFWRAVKKAARASGHAI